MPREHGNECSKGEEKQLHGAQTQKPRQNHARTEHAARQRDQRCQHRHDGIGYDHKQQAADIVGHKQSAAADGQGVHHGHTAGGVEIGKHRHGHHQTIKTGKHRAGFRHHTSQISCHIRPFRPPLLRRVEQLHGQHQRQDQHPNSEIGDPDGTEADRIFAQQRRIKERCL